MFFKHSKAMSKCQTSQMMRMIKKDKITDKVSSSADYKLTTESGSESYDEDEEYDAKERQPESDAKNSALAVGYKSDRSFVVRGDRIGVFKHTDHDSLGELPLIFWKSLTPA
jgi:hypothetical protein